MATLASVILRDIAANRPAAGTAGRLFFDTTNVKMQRDNGSSWDDVAETSAAAPGAELDYVQITAPVNVTATTEATANAIVTGSSVSYNGSTIVIIEFFAYYIEPSQTATRSVVLWLYEDGTSIGAIGNVQTPASAALHYPVITRVRKTPSNASHTYSIRGTVSAGTGVVAAGPGGSGQQYPAYIRITRV